MKFYECPICRRVFTEREWKEGECCPKCKEYLIKTDSGEMERDDRKT